MVGQTKNFPLFWCCWIRVPRSGMDKKSGSGKNIPDPQPCEFLSEYEFEAEKFRIPIQRIMWCPLRNGSATLDFRERGGRAGELQQQRRPRRHGRRARVPRPSAHAAHRQSAHPGNRVISKYGTWRCQNTLRCLIFILYLKKS
jgi:hypothetical protein